MVRTVKSQNEDYEEEEDEEFNSHKGKLEGKSNNGKRNSHRSKHSETEQRRRIKINERFQALRDLIPENDQKRDRASFLLEVIQYIQFLQEKLQMYEGTTYQGWSAEPSKLMPWRSTSGPVEGFAEQSQIVRNGSTHEDNIVVNPTLLASAQNSVDPNSTVAALYRVTDDPHMAANEAMAFNMPLQSNLFENESVQPSQSSPDAENCNSQLQSLYWPGKQDVIDSDVPSCGRNDQQEVRVDGEEAGISNVYSQRLLNTLNQTLASMGVDMSQANVRVQLDVGKSPSSGTTATTLSREDNCDHMHKRLRTEDSM